MSLSKKNALTIGIGALIIALTVIVFLSLPYQKEYIDTLGFGAVIGAEIISVFACVIFNKASAGSSRVMFSAGAYTAIIIYMIASLAFSIVCMVYLRSATNSFLAVESIFLALLLIVLIIIYAYGKRLSQENDVTEEQMASMGTLESNVQLMRDDPDNGKYSRQLNAIFEAIKSCDQSVFTKTDELVSSRIYDLNTLLQSPEAPYEKVSELSEHIMRLINQRTLEVKQLKRGGI